MTHLYFHCDTPHGLLADRRGSEVEDLADASDRAEAMILACIAKPGPEDWRSWTFCISDADGDELLEVPFAAVLGRLH
jgi:hypothetical protein